MATDLEELERITKAMNPVGLPNFANQARSGLQNQLPAGEGTVLAPITPTVEIDLSGLPNQTPEEDEVEILNLGYIKNPDGSYSKKTTFSTPEPTPESKTATQEMVEARAAARGGVGSPDEGGGGLISQIFETPLQMDKNANKFMSSIRKGANELMGGFQRAVTPESELGYKPAPLSEVFNVTIPERSPLYKAPVETTSGISAPTQEPQPAAVPAQPDAVPAQPAAVPAQPAAGFDAGSAFNGLNPSVPSEGIGQVAAPSPFDTNQSTNPILAPQLEQDFTQPQLNVPQSLQNPFATQPQVNGLTTQGGIPLNQFLSGQALPEQGLLRAENPMFGDDSQSRGLSGIPAQEAMAQASADRIARLDARPDFGGGVSDRDRRGAGDISKADYDDMAQGMLPGASASERGRALKLGNELGVNPATGQPLKSAEGLTFEQQLALRKQDFVEDAAKLERDDALKSAEGLKFDRKLALRKQNFVEDVAKLEWDKSDEETKIKRVDEMNTEIAALNSAIDQGKTVQDVGERAQRGINWRTAGFFSPLRFVGGTDAASLEGNLETIKADAFVSNITDMRNNSPTGGSVGNVSDADLLQMQSLQRSFQQKQAPKDLKRNISEYLKIRNRVIERTSKRFIRTYGQENFDKYFGNNATGSSNTGGSSSSIPNDRDVPSKADSFLLPPSK